MVVWAPGGARRLQGRQCRALYRQAATVPAGYYDVFSGEQILDWHHAAGDFVVRLDEADELALRLVTVRRYGALLRDPPGDLASALLHLALFLVHTTLWLRLDRCRGVGDLVMADPAVVGPVLGGIGDALALNIAGADAADIRLLEHREVTTKMAQRYNSEQLTRLLTDIEEARLGVLDNAMVPLVLTTLAIRINRLLG